MGPGLFQGGLPVLDGDHLEAGLFELERHQVTDVGVVVGDQDHRHGLFPPSRPGGSPGLLFAT
jgi:hypothetical protein